MTSSLWWHCSGNYCGEVCVAEKAGSHFPPWRISDVYIVRVPWLGLRTVVLFRTHMGEIWVSDEWHFWSLGQFLLLQFSGGRQKALCRPECVWICLNTHLHNDLSVLRLVNVSQHVFYKEREIHLVHGHIWQGWLLKKITLTCCIVILWFPLNRGISFSNQ